MVSLSQVYQVTVSSPWNAYNPSSGMSGRGSVFNPTYPIFVFDYQTGQIAVGYVVGTTGYALFGQGDANYLTLPAIYLTPFGYNYVFAGGGECSVSGCMQNGSNACGPWWIIVNLSSNSVNTYCTGLIPNNPATAHLQGVFIDLVNGNLLIDFSGTSNTNFVINIIPLSNLNQVIQNQAPSNLKSVWINLPSNISSASQYANQGTLFNGNYVQPLYSSNGPYVFVVSLSDIYSSAVTGEPSSSSSPINIGTAYSVATLSQMNAPIVGVVFNGSTEQLALGVPSGSNYNVYVLNTSFSVVSSYSFTYQGSQIGFAHAFWNGVFLLPSYSSSTIYVNVYTSSYEYASESGQFGFVTSEGYFVVASQSLTSSSVTFTIYQILLDHTYVFQNVSITVSGNTVTATGTLFDLTQNSAVSGATVYLVQVNSIDDNYSGDVTPLTSGTTNQNGQFSISYTVSSSGSGQVYYGVYYPGSQL